MNMPGFTAALSLPKKTHWKTTYRYVSEQVGAVNRGVTPVVPSLFTFTHADCQWPCRAFGTLCVCP